MYNRQCRSKQCFKCWIYGHLSTACPQKGRQVCGKCSGGHIHKECTAKAYRCPVCQSNHKAWNRVCIAKKREITRIQQAGLWTPRRSMLTKHDSTSYQSSASSQQREIDGPKTGSHDKVRELPPESSSAMGPEDRVLLHLRPGTRSVSSHGTIRPHDQDHTTLGEVCRHRPPSRLLLSVR